MKNRIISRINTIIRYGMIHTLSDVIPLYTINEFPKSGGTWLGQMLGSALDIPFPKNQMPVFRESIMHGHYLSSWGMKNTIVLFRDGRDVMVSWYHHCLFKNEHHNARLVNQVRKNLSLVEYKDVKHNLPKFIEYSFAKQRHPTFSWAEFVRNWYNQKDAVFVRYEDLRARPNEELARIVMELTGKAITSERASDVVEQYSFERLAGRKPGEERKASFMRKGIVGDWRNYFNKEACELFEYYGGRELRLLGYESNADWVSRLE